MKYGYARVSTIDQNLDVQVSSLKAAGCKAIVKDKGISSNTVSHLGLDRLLKSLTTGDTLAVYKLDRLGKDTVHVLQIVSDLEARGITFQSLTQDIDTSTPRGKLFLQLCAIMVENEHTIIKERVTAGMRAAKERGVKLGAPSKLTEKQIRQIKDLLEAGESVSRVAKKFAVTRPTIYAYLKNNGNSSA